jgi:type IV pilus assembly protein PilA
MKKGFTLVELLAVIVILAIILSVAIPSISGIIEKSQINALISDEKMMVKAAKIYSAVNDNYSPKNVGETKDLPLSELQTNNYISTIKSPKDKNLNCSGYVLITKITNDNYDYTPVLNCINTIANSSEDGLVAYWKLDGNAYDYSVNHNNGIVTGTTSVSDRFGIQNQALSFNGTTDSIRVIHNATLDITNNLTISAWVNFANLDYSNNTGRLHMIMQKGYPDVTTSHYGWWFAYDNRNNRNKFNYTCFGNANGGWSGGLNNFNNINYDLESNKWYNLTFTITATEAKFYIDGEKYGNTVSISNLQLSDVTRDLYIGSNGSIPSFNGILDDIRIYRRILTSEEIKENYKLDIVRN